MNYEPKMLINNTDHAVEFMCGGRTFIFQPGEKKILEGFEAYHALHEVNTGLNEYGEEIAKPAYEGFEKLSWKQLREMTDSKGNKVYRMGMSREDLIKAIKDAK